MGDAAKFILAVGGEFQGSRNFSRAISDENDVLHVAKSIVTVLNTFELDGVDIAWLNLIDCNESKADKINLIMLLRQLRLQMAAGMSLSLTAVLKPEYYDLVNIDVYVDFVNLMTIDFHDPKKPSHVAPLFSRAKQRQSNIVSLSMNEGKMI